MSVLPPSSYIPLQILAGCALGMNIIEGTHSLLDFRSSTGTFSMILLADTGLQCNFVPFYQSFVAGGMLLVRISFHNSYSLARRLSSGLSLHVVEWLGMLLSSSFSPLHDGIFSFFFRRIIILLLFSLFLVLIFRLLTGRPRMPSK
jgi:hypothetical protein